MIDGGRFFDPLEGTMPNERIDLSIFNRNRWLNRHSDWINALEDPDKSSGIRIICYVKKLQVLRDTKIIDEARIYHAIYCKSMPSKESMQENIECPLCYEYYSLPLYSEHYPMIICANSHSTCLRCSEKFKICSFCRGNILEKIIPNLTMASCL